MPHNCLLSLEDEIKKNCSIYTMFFCRVFLWRICFQSKRECMSPGAKCLSHKKKLHTYAERAAATGNLVFPTPSFSVFIFEGLFLIHSLVCLIHLIKSIQLWIECSFFLLLPTLSHIQKRQSTGRLLNICAP